MHQTGSMTVGTINIIAEVRTLRECRREKDNKKEMNWKGTSGVKEEILAGALVLVSWFLFLCVRVCVCVWGGGGGRSAGRSVCLLWLQNLMNIPA